MLALALLAGTILLALVIAVSWLAYAVAGIRAEGAYISELNKVVTNMNALAHSVHLQHNRSATRIDRAGALASAANEKTVDLGSRVETIQDRINQQAAESQDISEDVALAQATAEGGVANSMLNTDTIGDHAVRIVSLEATAAGTLTEADLGERLQQYVREEDLPQQDLDGFARWDELDGANLTVGSLRSEAVEIADPSSGETASITYSPDGLRLVSGVGNQATTLAPTGIDFGPNSLRIDAEGDLAYCKGTAPCRKLQA